MVRLAIPRRLYTNMQILYVAESIIELYRHRDMIRGLTLAYEAPVLRHFTARFQEARLALRSVKKARHTYSEAIESAQYTRDYVCCYCNREILIKP
jgi:hypothetical protein